MSDSWKISLPCNREEAEMLSEDNLFLASHDATPTMVVREGETGAPNEWILEIFCEAEPDTELLLAVQQLSPSALNHGHSPEVTRVPEADWLTISQAGLPPLRAGRFYIHGSHVAASTEAGVRNFHIDASQAFGTGHHETTLGCIRLLDAMRRRGTTFRNVIDVGTGSGLLALAAAHLWPSARVTASDLDQIAVDVAGGNITGNGFRRGSLPGQISLLTANGVDHPVIRRRTPYDLIIANILAGPLTMLAPHIASVAAPGSTLILAGLLCHQLAGVAAAYSRAGYRLNEVLLENEWPCLRLVKRRNRAAPQRLHGRKSPLADDYFGEC